MVSRITRLSLPIDEAPVAGWDATIDPDPDADIKSSSSTAQSLAALAAGRSMRTSISPHAMAHEHLVCGIDSSNGNDWIAWKTSLAPHRVCQVANNASGNLIAATLDNGTLSILRGTDGTVLATRRVAPEGTRLPASVEFVVGTAQTGEGAPDTLIIVPPEEGPPILVSNMQGDRLNSLDNPGVVSEAARSMGLHALRLDGCDDIRAMRGLALPSASTGDKNHEAMIRLAVVDGDGRLAIYDYDLKNKTAVLIQRNVDIDSKDEHSGASWEIDLEVGLRVQVVPISEEKTAAYLLFCQYSGIRTKVCWLNLDDLTVSCEYSVYVPKSEIILTKRARILAMESVTGSSAQDTLAIVLTIKFPGDVPIIESRVLQAVVGDALDETAVRNPHLVYTIPVPPTVQFMAIATVSEISPYAFTCKTWSGNDTYDCHLFQTTKSSKASVGGIRLLCAKEKFLEAQELLIQSQDDSFVKDPFARFHSSEITVKRLDRVLDAGSVSTPQAMSTAQECLQQLVKGVLSGNSLGQKALLTVADRILNWPDEKALQNPPSVQEVVAVLEGMIAAMASVSDAFAGSEEYSTKATVLKERLLVMKYVQDILQPEERESPIKITKSFAGVQNFIDLFSTLVRNGYFAAAENLSKTNLRSKLTAESMASSVVSISPQVSPRLYSNLLVDTIIPNLSIGHELLPPILAWACRTADAFDVDGDNENSLDDAIFLLESAERATKNLRMRLHSSFSIYTPFVEKAGAKRRKMYLSKSSNASIAVPDMSFSSAASGHSIFEERETKVAGVDKSQSRPNPTILEMGRLKGGAQKTRLGGQLASMDAVDETEDTVEFKLSSARCLKYARSLGLDSHLITLGTFAKCGGAQHIAQALVKEFSESSSSHQERTTRLCNQVQPFCTRTGASFDEALTSYVRDLCGGKTTSKGAIEEAASVARCGTTASTKCQVTLIALKAALFCRFSSPWLSKLSQEAIEWAAGDSSLRSELEEASRLLLIDGIVGRYCGEGAKELFHVDNPRHAIRLLQFVARHFEHDSVLEDSLDLCDAFAHLNREDACSRILENAILKGDQETAAKLLVSLYERNILLARATFSRVIAFCTSLIEEAVPDNKGGTESTEKKFSQAVSCALVLTTIALSKIHSHASTNHEGFSTIHFDESSLDNLLNDLKRLDTLQDDHFVCLPLSALRAPNVLVKTVSNMLIPVVEAYLAENVAASSTIVTQTKRACTLLAGCCQLDSSDLWYAAVGSSACRLAMKSNGQECISFMSDLGVFEAAHNSLAARSCLAVALSFCLKASKIASSTDSIRPGMKHIIMALSLLQDHAVLKCPKHLLDTTLSVTELCDVVSQVLVRSDEGIGEELDDFRKTLQGTISPDICGRTNAPLVRRPPLQSTWYVGDGLLLPPSETLIHALQYCKQALRAPSQSEAALNLHSFVDGRGAYSLGLRLLTVATAGRMSAKEDDPSYFGIEEAGKKIIVSLAERYVGGTSNGITSGIVDSQLAVSVLLCLPLKMAFSVYKSSLPTAISTRDFSRVITLANVGITAGTGKLFTTSPGKPMQHWVRQRKFVVQCQELALRAKWWETLQECGVQFEPNRFQDSSQASNEKTKASTKYVISLLPSFIWSLSRRHSDPQEVFKYVIEFADAFGLERDVPVQKYVAYLLSPPSGDKLNAEHSVEDIRLKLARLDAIVKSLLRRLESQVDRVSVLRECLVRLEGADTSCDYERLSVVLTLYQSELSTLVIKAPKESIMKTQIQELELIDRRRDALAILSWFFQGDMANERPAFSELFLSLPESWDCDYRKNVNRIGRMIIGLESVASSEVFDPLRPLDKVLNSSKGAAAVSALAPLCLPLGVPRGYIHARSLLVRFKKSKETGAALPSFEDDVLPVLNRLKFSNDVADLAEWCSSQYRYEDEDKLHCIDHSLTFAVKASSESEAKSVRSTGKDLMQEEIVSKALDRVKRITASKDILADRLAINAILTSAGTAEDESTSFGDIVKTLVGTLDSTVWRNEEFVPEEFVETFIREASLIASEACLNSKKAMSVGQFRQFSVLVQRASTALAEKYSHVQVGSIARRLARRWLFYGDRNTSTESTTSDSDSPNRKSATKVGERMLHDIDEDDTMNFVMDLNALQQGSDDWTNNGAASQQETGLTLEEEPQILCHEGSAREVSDFSSRRAALRVAFVMTFAGPSSIANTADIPGTNNENQEPPQNTKIKPSRLRSKLSAKGSKSRSDGVLEHSRELLRIVFARSVASGWIVRDLDASFDTKAGIGSSRDSNQTITFAMRHRALRVASILCPQDALQQVVDEEELMHGSQSTLTMSAFAAFVAKEVEEMGLPLPHSDLAQLSTMHYPSYARTLWRHHRDDKRSKGRLLLLILEMYMKDRVSDHDFFSSVLAEINKSKLPRTLLLAFECICTHLESMDPDHAVGFIEKGGGGLAIMLRSLSERIIEELRSIGSVETQPQEGDIDAILTTLHRTATVVQCLAKIPEIQKTIRIFVDGLRHSVPQAILLNQDFEAIVQSLLRHGEFKTVTQSRAREDK